jgi:hypothetical protein
MRVEMCGRLQTALSGTDRRFVFIEKIYPPGRDGRFTQLEMMDTLPERNGTCATLATTLNFANRSKNFTLGWLCTLLSPAA